MDGSPLLMPPRRLGTTATQPSLWFWTQLARQTKIDMFSVGDGPRTLSIVEGLIISCLYAPQAILFLYRLHWALSPRNTVTQCKKLVQLELTLNICALTSCYPSEYSCYDRWWWKLPFMTLTSSNYPEEVDPRDWSQLHTSVRSWESMLKPGEPRFRRHGLQRLQRTEGPLRVLGWLGTVFCSAKKAAENPWTNRVDRRHAVAPAAYTAIPILHPLSSNRQRRLAAGVTASTRSNYRLINGTLVERARDTG